MEEKSRRKRRRRKKRRRRIEEERRTHKIVKVQLQRRDIAAVILLKHINHPSERQVATHNSDD